MRGFVLTLAGGMLLAGCFGGGNDEGAGSGTPTVTGDGNTTTGVRLVTVATGLESPLLVTHAGDGSGRIFIVEQPGRIQVFDAGANASRLYGDISGRLTSGGEQGLLGLAFLPDNPTILFLSYTDQAGDSVLSRFKEKDGALDAGSEEVLLQVDQPFSNHNGGHLAFGPDGMIYLGLGDGGFADDPEANGQRKETLLGDLLRLQVGASGGYTIPAGNPYIGHAAFRPEIWASGLRNPWRFSFDRQTGDLWIADVGQDQWEEIDFQVAGAPGGANYGWNIYEGSYLLPTSAAAQPSPPGPGMTHPVAEYGHDPGGHCSITGGYVYRGLQVSALKGLYVVGDYCSGQLWTMAGPAAPLVELLDTDYFVSSFGEDEAGELYLASHTEGAVYRFASGAATTN